MSEHNRNELTRIERRDPVDEIAEALNAMYPDLPPITEGSKDACRRFVDEVNASSPMPMSVAKRISAIWLA